MNHNVTRIKDLLYKGCEEHWQCIYCHEAFPVTKYTQKEIENIECKGNVTKSTTLLEQTIADVNTDYIAINKDLELFGAANAHLGEAEKESASFSSDVYKTKLELDITTLKRYIKDLQSLVKVIEKTEKDLDKRKI